MHLVQAGVNLIYIRDLLGHADVSTTEIYARADAETRRRAIEDAYEPLHPGRPAGLDLGLVPARLARLAGAMTPAQEDYADHQTSPAALPAETPRQGT